MWNIYLRIETKFNVQKHQEAPFFFESIFLLEAFSSLIWIISFCLQIFRYILQASRVSKHHVASSLNLQAALRFFKIKLRPKLYKIIQRVGTTNYIYIILHEKKKAIPNKKSFIFINVSQKKKAIENSRKTTPIRIFNETQIVIGSFQKNKYR